MIERLRLSIGSRLVCLGILIAPDDYWTILTHVIVDEYGNKPNYTRKVS